MRRLLPLFALIPALVPLSGASATVERALTGGETGTASLSYALAALGLVLALGGAQWLVSRR